MTVKQVIVVRTDLNMRKGKMCAQVAHASMMMFLARRFPDWEVCARNDYTSVESFWLENSYPKIVVGIGSERELLDLIEAAHEEGVEVYEVIDEGRTEFNGVLTLTCAAFGPAPSVVIDKITGGLKLL